MQRSPNTNLHQSNGMAPSAEQVEEVLRFARKLEMHSDHTQLLRALPAELCVLVDCAMAALVHLNEGQLTTQGAVREGGRRARDNRAGSGQGGFGKPSRSRRSRSFCPRLTSSRRMPTKDFPRLFIFFANAAINLFA